MNNVTALVAASFAVVLVACSAGDDDNAASTASALSVVDACTAVVTCDLGDEGTTTTRLSKDAAGCHLGGMTLAAGGAVVAKDVNGAIWKSTTTGVAVCAGDAPDVCIQCTAAAPGTLGTAPKAAAGKCIGYPTSCSSLGPGSCAPQDGCSMDLDFEYCEGTSRSCDEYDSKSSCEGQRGCSWK